MTSMRYAYVDYRFQSRKLGAKPGNVNAVCKMVWQFVKYVKSLNSNSWFICIQKLLIKYGLPQATELLDNPPSTYRWKTLMKKHIDEYWMDQMRHKAKLYSSLRFLHTVAYVPGRTHPLIQEVVGVRDVARIQTKLRLVTGTYVWQTNRSAFNQNQISPVCLLCRAEDETTEHFLLRCTALEIVWQPALMEILEIYVQHFGEPVHSDILVQIILDGGSM